MSLEDYRVLILRRMKSVRDEDEGLNNPSLRHSNIIPKHLRLNGEIPFYLCFAFGGSDALITCPRAMWSTIRPKRGALPWVDTKCFRMEDDELAHRFDHYIRMAVLTCNLVLKRKERVRASALGN